MSRVEAHKATALFLYILEKFTLKSLQKMFMIGTVSEKQKEKREEEKDHENEKDSSNVIYKRLARSVIGRLRQF